MLHIVFPRETAFMSAYQCWRPSSLMTESAIIASPANSLKWPVTTSVKASMLACDPSHSQWGPFSLYLSFLWVVEAETLGRGGGRGNNVVECPQPPAPEEGPGGAFDCVTQSARTKTPLLALARRPGQETPSATDPGRVHGGFQGWMEGLRDGRVDGRRDGWWDGLIGKGWLNDGVMARTVDGRRSIRIAGWNAGSRYWGVVHFIITYYSFHLDIGERALFLNEYSLVLILLSRMFNLAVS